MTLEFSGQVFEKYSNIKFHLKNCSLRKDGRFSPFGERASNSKELMSGNVGGVLRK
jgi:hypothetical protein